VLLALCNMRRVTLISGGYVLSLLVLVMGCSKHPKGAGKPAPTASAAQKLAQQGPPMSSTSGNVSAPLSGASRGSSVPSSTADDPRFDEVALVDEAIALFERESLVAHKLMSQKQYAKAIKHFTLALGTGRPDAQALGERGYAHYLLKDQAAAKSDFWDAAGARAPESVQAQIWYNLGLFYEDESEPEMSRTAFAISYAKGKSTAAKTKLGGRSACRSRIAYGPIAKDELGAVVVKGWLGVHQHFNLEGMPKSEAEAKKIVCHTVSRALGGPPEDPEGVCTGASPWQLSCCAETGGFLFRQMFVVEGHSGSFFTYDAGVVGGWPRECRGHPGPTLNIQGDNVFVTTVGSDMSPNNDYLTAHPQVEQTAEPPCRQSPELTTVEVFSLATGKRRLKVSSYSTTTPPTITISDAGTEATICGNDCDETRKL